MTNLIEFEQNQVRRIEHNGEWWFSIIDIIQILTDSAKPSNYWDMLKRKENELSMITGKFKFLAADGKMRATECANTEGVFRVIMSVPSPKAEPFKLWLAQVGKEALDELASPEILSAKQAEMYRAKGYPEEWITSRMKSIEIRKELTDEWKQRGVTEGQEYSILTAEIAKATFGLTPTEHKDLKGLNRQNLRDHMTNLELVFTMLGEEVTRGITVADDAQGLNESLNAATDGGGVANRALNDYEKRTGNKVVSSDNFLKQIPPASDEIESVI
jgi:DNA-damage-inducible protein D